MDVMAMLYTQNWQVNVLAWYSLGQPKKILLFLSEGVSQEIEKAKRLCCEFFQSKGCTDIQVCDDHLKLRQSPTEHQAIIQKFIQDQVRQQETCVLFRSAAKHLMREGMLLAYQALSQDPNWKQRIETAVLEEGIFVQSFRGEQWSEVSAPDLEFGDYVKIAGYHLHISHLLPGNNEDMPPAWRTAFENLVQYDSLATLWGACIRFKNHCHTQKQWNSDRGISQSESAIICDLDGDLESNLSEIAQFFPESLQPNNAFLDARKLEKEGQNCKIWQNYKLWIGMLWEKVFARIWLLGQLQQQFGDRPDSYRLYTSAEIKLSPQGSTLAELDYVVVFPNGRLLFFECKTSAEGSQSPQQAEVRNRLADKLTGQKIETCFLLPAKGAREKDEIQREMGNKYPKELGFSTIAARLDQMNQASPELQEILHKIFPSP